MCGHCNIAFYFHHVVVLLKLQKSLCLLLLLVTQQLRMTTHVQKQVLLPTILSQLRLVLQVITLGIR